MAFSLPEPWQRVYHFHIRKTAGTSLNAAFWALAGLDRRQFGQLRGAIVEHNGVRFVRHMRGEVEAGHWDFGASHINAHSIALPPDTFTITVLRDPLTRLVSLYQYLHYAQVTGDLDGTGDREREKASGSFHDFVHAIGHGARSAQLSMFSPSRSVDDAFVRAAKVDAILFTEDFDRGVGRLGEELGLPLAVMHERRFPKLATISDAELEDADAMLADEREFVDAMREFRG